MTDFAPRPDDEIVSAHLDGEATPDEAARVEADPGSRERLEQFDAVRAEVAAPVRADAVAREAALAAALDVYDREVAPHVATATPTTSLRATPTTPVTDAPSGGSGATPSLAPGGPGAPGASVVDLSARRPARGLQILSAAAAILLVLGLAGAVRVAQRSNDANTTADVALDSGALSEVQSKAAGSAPELTNDGAVSSGGATRTTLTAPLTASSPSPTVPPPSTPVVPSVAPTTVSPTAKVVVVADLGPVANRDDLVHRIATEMTGGLTSATDSGTPTTVVPGADAAAATMASCDNTLRSADFEIGTLTFEATLTYAGTAAYAYVYSIDQQAHPAANGPARLYVVSPSCQVLDVETL
jgi:hypothetical protein